MIPEKISRALYWQSQKLRGRVGVKERLAWLEQTQWLAPAQLQQIQAEKLQQIIAHAYRTVPYYRRIMDEAGVKPGDIMYPADLAKLPLLTRQRLQQNQVELLSSEADAGTLQRNFSSGSTGVRACFSQDLNFRVWMRAHQLRTYQWCSNWQIGQRFVLLWGSEIYWSLKSWADRIDNLISNRREFNTFRLSPDLIASFVDNLRRFDPVLISSYTNAMHLIAREAERRKVTFKSLRAIQLTSEPVPPAFRERLERIFNCEIYDKYGSRETNIVSHEAPDHQAMCIQVENVVVEVLDDHDQPCPPGKTGRLVLTTLNNLAMPLIRYETSDLAALVSGFGTSGLGLPRMSSVAGRQQDLIVNPHGDHIDAYFFSYLFMRFEEIDWFQVVQRIPEALLVRVYAPRGISPGTLDSLRERIHHHCGFPYRIEFEVSSTLPESPTGKFRLCVSELGRSATATLVNEQVAHG